MSFSISAAALVHMRNMKKKAKELEEFEDEQLEPLVSRSSVGVRKRFIDLSDD